MANDDVPGERSPRVPVVRALRRTVGFAWTHVRREFVLLLVAGVATALLPAAQVLLVGRLTTAVAAGNRGRIFPLLAGTALVVGLAAALSDVESALWRSQMNATRGRMSSVLVERMATLSPSQVADPQWSARGQEAREAIQQFAAYHLNAIIGCLEGAVTGVSLVMAVDGRFREMFRQQSEQSSGLPGQDG